MNKNEKSIMDMRIKNIVKELETVKKDNINVMDYCEYLENKINILTALVIYLLKPCNVIESQNDDNINTIIENKEVL